MVRRQQESGMQPWPAELAEFDAAVWPNRRAWHAARLRVAKSLGRPPLPEVRGMVLVKRNNNGKVL